MGVPLVLLCLGVVSAHNWLTSPARGNQGANYNGWTSPPCPQKGERVHVQVQAGQRFPIEWASGHGYGSYTFFVVLDAKDESNMIQHTMENLDDYLKKAPSTDYMKDTWAMHANPPGHTQVGMSLVSTPITSSWWPGGRPAAFRTYQGTVEVYNKTITSVSADKRARYTNPAMPWIISVHKFALHEDQPEQMDLAFLEIPTGYPSGQYVVQYLWNGYYDCVDVNVLDVKSTDIFGTASADLSLDRIDHCVYNSTLANYVVQSGCVEIKPGDSPQPCIEACAKNNEYEYSACHGVQITPVTLPSTAKFPGTHQAGTSHLPASASDKCDWKSFAPTSSVCYPVRIGPAPIVGPPYKVVADPEDSVFYSTCYRKKPGWSFAQTCSKCKPPALKGVNKFGFTQQSCVTCRDMYTNQSPLAAPVWTMDNVCFSCDGTLG